MSGRIARIVLWLVAALAVSAQAQTVEYLHTDALGSVVAVTDANRNVIERREYEPYGSQLTPAVSNGPGYTGHVQDASSGLVYMQQRYYDAQLGRFLSVDPVTADGSTGGNFNRYWYANNNPYSVTDPDGRCGTRIKDHEVPSCTTIYVNPSNGGGASSAAGQQTSSTQPAAVAATTGSDSESGILDHFTPAANKQPVLPTAGTPLDKIRQAAIRASESTKVRIPFLRGIIIHHRFARNVRALGPGFAAEVSYKDGGLERYGLLGTVRTDAQYGPLAKPDFVVELKTGGATMSRAEYDAYERHLPAGTPVYEIRERW